MNNQKICSFYISEFHLLTILLPYINEKIEEQKEVAVILQNDISGNVTDYLNNVRNLNLNAQKIVEIGWNKSEKENVTNNLEGKVVIVIGEKDYIEEINKKIELSINVEEVLNCYRINDIERIDKVLSKHNKVLKTEGKSDVKNFSQNTQKRETIKTQI